MLLEWLGDLQDHGLVSWYFFEQLVVELLVDALKAQSCADIYCMRICMLFEWKCWTNCVFALDIILLDM